MLRQLYKMVTGAQRSRFNIQTCLRANYCSHGEEEHSMSGDAEEGTSVKSSGTSFCDVNLLGRVGVKPTLVEGSTAPFVKLLVGVGNQRSGTKWHEVIVNRKEEINWLLKYIDAGDRLYVKGGLSYQQNDNNKFYRIFANQVKLINHSQKNWAKLHENKEHIEAES